MKKLMRSVTDKKLTGVCGGVADYFGVDATAVRIAWVVASIFWGVGVVLYIVCALIMPENDGTQGYYNNTPNDNGQNYNNQYYNQQNYNAQNYNYDPNMQNQNNNNQDNDSSGTTQL